jgi:hypothetical protein
MGSVLVTIWAQLGDNRGPFRASRLCPREHRAAKLLRQKQLAKLLRQKQLAKLLRQELQVQTAAKRDDFARRGNGDDAPRVPPIFLASARPG